jgi:hypothetical protein
MINFVTNPYSFQKTYGNISGWIPDAEAGKNNDKNTGFTTRKALFKSDTPTIFYPLRYIFGFTDYKKLIHMVDNMILTLNRNKDDEIAKEIFYGEKSATAGTADPKLDILEFEWWIPSYTLNLEAQKYFEGRLAKNPIMEMTYMKRYASPSITFTAAKSQHSIAGISKQVRYVFICFKSEASDMEKNNALMTAKKIRSIQVAVNGVRYPESPMKFDFVNGDIAEPYLAYIEACNYFNCEPQLSAQEFKDLYPFFCINTSCQSELLKSGNEAVVYIEKDGVDQLEMFALLLEDSHISCNITNGVVTIL